MKPVLAFILILATFVPLKLKMEAACDRIVPGALSIDLREQIGQSAFIAVLGGFRSVMADLLFIDAYSAWERTDWTYLLLRLRQATELQPRAILFWEMAGWHMAWNAGTAAMEDDSKSPAARRRLQHDYLELGEDFLVRGIAYNPEKPQLYEALARLYRDKFHDHVRAAENFLPARGKGAPPAFAKPIAGHGRAPENSCERKNYSLMRFAIFSDIHSNLEALEAVLSDARERHCTHFVCLGDVVGYNANPRECVEIVRDLDCPTVKGNHDEQASQPEASGDFNEMPERAMTWTRAQLSEEDRAWLRDLRLQRQVRDFTIVHATLDTPAQWGYVFRDLDAAASFTYQHTAVCFFGHTHIQCAFIRDERARRTQQEQIHVEFGKKYFVNAGSVGQPRDGDWRAAYCIYHADENLIEQRRVRYAIDKARKKIIAAGLPRLLADRLALGR